MKFTYQTVAITACVRSRSLPQKFPWRQLRFGAVENPLDGGAPKAHRLPSKVRYSIVRPVTAADVRYIIGQVEIPPEPVNPRWSVVSAGLVSPTGPLMVER